MLFHFLNFILFPLYVILFLSIAFCCFFFYALCCFLYIAFSKVGTYNIALSFYIAFLFRIFKSWDQQYCFKLLYFLSDCLLYFAFLFKLLSFSGLVNLSGFVRPAWSIAQSHVIFILATAVIFIVVT